jgi:hypothetical protein
MISIIVSYVISFPFSIGGVGTDNNVLMNDIWSYDIKTRQWEEIDVGSATNRPLPREGHAMIKGPFEESSSFTIHGGMGYGYVPYEDTWTFDLGKFKKKKSQTVILILFFCIYLNNCILSLFLISYPLQVQNNGHK